MSMLIIDHQKHKCANALIYVVAPHESRLRLSVVIIRPARPVASKPAVPQFSPESAASETPDLTNPETAPQDVHP